MPRAVVVDALPRPATECVIDHRHTPRAGEHVGRIESPPYELRHGETRTVGFLVEERILLFGERYLKAVRHSLDVHRRLGNQQEMYISIKRTSCRPSSQKCDDSSPGETRQGCVRICSVPPRSARCALLRLTSQPRKATGRSVPPMYFDASALQDDAR